MKIIKTIFFINQILTLKKKYKNIEVNILEKV